MYCCAVQRPHIVQQQQPHEREQWVSSLVALFQQSDLTQVNDLSTHGERPLHVAVQHVLLRTLDQGIPATLIGEFAAHLDLLDARGQTAFAYAQGHRQLLTSLRTPFTGIWIPRAIQHAIAAHEWYLPTGFSRSYQPWFPADYLE